MGGGGCWDYGVGFRWSFLRIGADRRIELTEKKMLRTHKVLRSAPIERSVCTYMCTYMCGQDRAHREENVADT